MMGRFLKVQEAAKPKLERVYDADTAWAEFWPMALTSADPQRVYISRMKAGIPTTNLADRWIDGPSGGVGMLRLPSC
jgi:hypothetical protein